MNMSELGRPTDYSPEMLAKAWEYLESCRDIDWVEPEPHEEEEPQEHGGWLRRWRSKDYIYVKIPTKGGLARYLGVSRDTLYEWAKKHADFSDVMEALGSEQEDRLINKGLGGSYNSTITKVLLTKHGYREGHDMTSDDKALPTPIMPIPTHVQPDDSDEESREADEED